MSTNTNTLAKVIVKSDTEVSKAFGTYLTADAKAQNSFLEVGIVGLAVAKRQGYVEAVDVRSMFRLSIYHKMGVAEQKDDETVKAFEARQLEVADTQKTNISLWTSFVMCKDAAARDERDKALKYNESLPPGRVNARIGQKVMLDICRGSTTADYIIAVKEGREVADPNKGRTSGNQTVGAKADSSPKPDAGSEKGTGDETSNAPEAQNASAPSPTDKPVANPEDAARANLRIAFKAFEDNMGMKRERIAEILRELADELIAAK